MSTSLTLPTETVPATLPIRPWPDPVIDALGHDPRSTYVEQFWLGILGPVAPPGCSGAWPAGLEASPAGFELPLAETARALGLGDQGGRHSPFMRALARCCQFDLADARADGSPGRAPQAPAPQPAPGACACRRRCRSAHRDGRRPSCHARPPSSSGAGRAAWPSACSSWARTVEADRAPAPALEVPPGAGRESAAWAWTATGTWPKRPTAARAVRRRRWRSRRPRTGRLIPRLGLVPAAGRGMRLGRDRAARSGCARRSRCRPCGT